MDGTPKRGSALNTPRRVIGLVGTIASGKSTVAAMLANRGAEIIDADRVYHDLVATGSPLLRAIVARFGGGILHDNGSLNRGALGAIVFADPAALADLEQITHPAVVSEIRDRLARATAPVVVIEAIKLFESGLAGDVDQIWLVDADQEQRIQRLMERNALSRSEAHHRVAASNNPIPVGHQADTVIDNSGSLAATRQAVAVAWNRLIAGASATTLPVIV